MREYYVTLLLNYDSCKDCDKEINILNFIDCILTGLIIYDSNEVEIARYNDKLFEEYSTSEKRDPFYEYKFKIQCFDNVDENEFIHNYYLSRDDSNYIIRTLDDTIILYHSISDKTVNELYQEIRDFEFNKKGKLFFSGGFSAIAIIILYSLVKDPSLLATIAFPVSGLFAIKSGIIDQNNIRLDINHNKALIRRKRKADANKKRSFNGE